MPYLRGAESLGTIWGQLRRNAAVTLTAVSPACHGDLDSWFCVITALQADRDMHLQSRFSSAGAAERRAAKRPTRTARVAGRRRPAAGTPRSARKLVIASSSPHREQIFFGTVRLRTGRSKRQRSRDTSMGRAQRVIVPQTWHRNIMARRSRPAKKEPRQPGNFTGPGKRGKLGTRLGTISLVAMPGRVPSRAIGRTRWESGSTRQASGRCFSEKVRRHSIRWM